MLQTFKTGQELLQAVRDLSFDFTRETALSQLPREAAALFDQDGKRFRPALCFLFGQVHGLSPAELAPYARAVEMTHTASLVHDDVIDEAHERRRLPTLNHRYGNTTAVLAGDFLLAKVIGDLAAHAPTHALVGLTEAIKELADGEWLQHGLKVRFSATRAELETVARKKNGALMGWACATPAALAGAKGEHIMRAYELGCDIGLFFQILDDVNDFNVRSGKPFAQDLRVGQLNTVTVAYLEESPRDLARLRAYRDDSSVMAPEEFHSAIRLVHAQAIALEQNLSARFLSLFPGHAPEAEVFGKMLEKVREGFLPDGV